MPHQGRLRDLQKPLGWLLALASNAFLLTVKEQQRLARTIWGNRTLLPDHLGFERQCCSLQVLQELHPLRLLQQQTDSDCRADLLPIFLHRILFHI